MLTTRRTFLRGCAFAAGYACSSFQLPRAFAADPVERTGTAKFKFSLAAYSYRRLLSGKEPQLDLFDFADDCASMQLDGAELTSYYFPSQADAAYLSRLKAHCFRLGLDVSGTAVGNDFGHAIDVPQRSQQLAHVKKWIDHAQRLDAPVIRVFAGHVKKGQTAEAAHKLMVSGLEECCEYAGQRGIFLALENHGGPTATAEGLLKIVRDVDSPWLGVNMDTGNFHSDDIYAELATVAPYALNVQVKVVVSGPDKKRRPADFDRVAAILKESGYRGYIVLEYEEAGNPREECPKFIDQLREAFKA